MDFPVKIALRSKLAGEADGFIAKLNTANWNPAFATYLGGVKLDTVWAVRVNSQGQPVTSGTTESDDFPTSEHAFQQRRMGKSAAFVATLGADGQRIVWSSYFGGSKETYAGAGIALDDVGRVWFTGMTNSSDLPTQSPYQPTFGGGEFNGFLASLSRDGTSLCYGTYFGGRGRDGLEGIAVAGNIFYASGIFASPTLKQIRLTVQPGFGGAPFDAVVLGLEAPVDLRCR